MALVAYDNSDSSEFEKDDRENDIVVTLQKGEEPPLLNPTKKFIEDSDNSRSIFNCLPHPTNKKPAVIEEDDEFLHKKENINFTKPKAKITVPSLSDFKDVEDRPIARPKLANGKKSGLLSLLPQPRNSVTTTLKSLIPHVLAQKPKTTAKKKETLPTPSKNKSDPKSAGNHSDDSDNDDDDVQNDFFSINKPIETPIDTCLHIDMSSTIEPRTEVPKADQKKPHNIESYFKKDVDVTQDLQPDYGEASSDEVGEYYGNTNATGSSYNNNYGAPESSNSGDVLDEEAILKLCGTRGKRKREEIQIVDVNQQEVLDEARQLLMKGLLEDTSKRISSSKKKGNEPTNQQKRKHQITYLAHQAKANEAELQNQWANNRMSRRQTQSKYGF